MKAKRIYFPALALFVTLCACLVPAFTCCVILASQVAPLPHPHWLTVCLQHSKELRTAARIGMAAAPLGSLITLWLLLKTEAPATVRLHRHNIIMGVAFGAGGGFLMLGFGMGLMFLQAFQAPGGLNRLGGIEAFAKMALLGMSLAAAVFGALCLVVMVVPYSLITLVIRARQPSLAPPLADAHPPHNSPEYFHHTL